jgi:hypothetical protein
MVPGQHFCTWAMTATAMCWTAGGMSLFVVIIQESAHAVVGLLWRCVLWLCGTEHTFWLWYNAESFAVIHHAVGFGCAIPGLLTCTAEMHATSMFCLPHVLVVEWLSSEG